MTISADDRRQLLADEAVGMYVAGWITKKSGLTALTWLGVTSFTLKNWLKGKIGL